MRYWLITAFFFLCVSPLCGEESNDDDNGEIQEDAFDNETFEISEDERCYSRYYNLPHRYRDFYHYHDVDTETTWPSKLDTNLMEELWH